MADINHTQPGNPAKLAKVMVQLVNMPEPPVRLALGSDTVQAIQDKNASVAKELATHRALSVSTDFAAGE